MQTDLLVEKYSKQLKLVNTIGTIALSIGAVITVSVLAVNNFWHPKVSVTEVDYDKGLAVVEINGNQELLYVNSILSAKFGWGVKFGLDMNNQPNRVELLKDDKVRQILDVAQDEKITK